MDITLNLKTLVMPPDVLLQVLCVQDGMALLGQSELEVCYISAGADEYIPVKCSIHPDAINGSLLIVVVSSFAFSHCRNVCSCYGYCPVCQDVATLHLYLRAVFRRWWCYCCCC